MELKDNTINYVEFPARDLNQTRAFFHAVFGWQFTDYDPDYMAFDQQGICGGFYRADLRSDSESGAALIVLYCRDLDGIQARIEQAGGIISKPVFNFPGGCRFHFREPSGNEMAVWSDQVSDLPSE